MDWRRAQVAPDRTHHRLDGQPIYVRRFREVLKYHAPGLAPVCADDGAYHVDLEGEPAYGARFLRTFGFYEGRAAVEAADGWFHILPDGSSLYTERYAWCGNYQGERCTVRDLSGRYRHLRPDGARACAASWRYAGDYRDGIAVVQRDDGLHGHVDRAGAPVHDRWFLDLDVFHKAFARARDAAGWTHVDDRGEPAYARRFAAVEPFYNGQARVERFDGGLEVIDETGSTVVEVRAAALADAPVGEVIARTAWGCVRRVATREGEHVIVKTTRGTHDREVEVLRALAGHPGVPTLIDRRRFDATDRLFLSVREGEVSGEPRQLVARPRGEAIRVAREVLAVCATMHAMGWVHADVHPGNVLVGAPATLLDFACAVPASYARPWRGEVNWGVWEYVAPEQLADFGALDPSVDVYAAAALCAAMVVGAPIFRVSVSSLRAAGGWTAVRGAFLEAREAPLLEGLDERLRAVLAPALAFAPADRPTAQALGEALADV